MAWHWEPARERTGSKLAKHWNAKVDLEHLWGNDPAVLLKLQLLHTLSHLILVTSGTGGEDFMHAAIFAIFVFTVS